MAVAALKPRRAGDRVVIAPGSPRPRAVAALKLLDWHGSLLAWRSGSPRPPGRGRIEARTGFGDAESAESQVLHGLRAVAALKLACRRCVRQCSGAGSPRPPGRGRIEAACVGGIVASRSAVLHGLRAVAALKLIRCGRQFATLSVVLHGLRAVAALKRRS